MTRLTRYFNYSASRSNFKLITAVAGLLCLSTPMSAQNIGAEPLYGTGSVAPGDGVDFGDDASIWANDSYSDT